jgi:hypothetical protein
MRKLLGILAAAAFAMTATSATAATVNGTAKLSVSIQGLAPITLTSTGVSWDQTGSTVTVGAGLVAQTAPIVIAVTGATAIQSVSASGIANQAGTFSLGGITAQLPGEVCASAAPGQACNSGGGVGGAMGLTGTVNVSVIPGVVVIPVNLDTAGIGQGGAVSAPFTFDNAGFTTGQAFVRTTNAAAGSQQFTVTGSNAGGTISLVTPTFLSALGNVLPVTTTLTLIGPSVPEPGTILLLASGLAGLAMVGRRRQ